MNKFLLSIALVAALLTGCNSGTPGTPSGSPAAQKTPAEPVGFQVKVSADQALPFEAKQARVDIRPDLTEGQFSIANHDFVMEHMGANSVPRPTEDGKVRISFGLKGEKGEDFQNPIQPGTYPAEKVLWVDIYSGKGGEEMITNLENYKGAVTIETVNDKELTGKIDITGDGGATVKGDFKAERVPSS